MTMENEKETEQEELEVEIEEPKNEEPEVVDEQPKQEATPKEEDEDYSQRVQRRINKLVQQRKESDAKAEEKEQELNALKQRLERLEQGETQKAQKQFEDRYVSVKQEMQKAIEEGDYSDLKWFLKPDTKTRAGDTANENVDYGDEEFNKVNAFIQVADNILNKIR